MNMTTQWHYSAVSRECADDYETNVFSIISKVNEMMEIKNAKMHLIGSNPVSVMHDNHKNHGRFMVNVLKLNDYHLLEETIKWVINSYKARGFSYQYFDEVLETWIESIGTYLQPKSVEQIIPVYENMKKIKTAIESFKDDAHQEDKHINSNIQEAFINTVLAGDHISILEMVKRELSDRASIEHFYMHIIQPTMYEIGMKWQRGEITVAHEHLATSIVMRTMAFIYANYIAADSTKGKIIISASHNEYHEIGARIVADFLELDGFNVTYLGANLPSEDLIQLLLDEKPDILGLSVTMPYNLDKIEQLLIKIKKMQELKHLKIMLGGYVFSYAKDTHKYINADKIVSDPYDALIAANEWWRSDEAI